MRFLHLYSRFTSVLTLKTCIAINHIGGMGHTAAIYSNSEETISAFASSVSAGRIIVNSPAAQGAVGGIFNTLLPSLTLGCGTFGNNITTDNVSCRHLLNIQRLLLPRPNEAWARVVPFLLDPFQGYPPRSTPAFRF